MPNAKVVSFQYKNLTEHAPQLPMALTEAASTAARVTNEALKAVGTNGAKLDSFGDLRIHPLAEAYYSQTSLRYGSYLAKLAVVPVAAAQRALAEAEAKVDGDKNPSLRTALVGYLREHDAKFEVRVQHCTALEKMPIEDVQGVE